MTSQTARAPMPQTPVLLRETLGSIAVLTLNRPAARNSLSEDLIAELARGAYRHSRRQKRPSGGDRGQWPGFFRWPRYEGIDRPPRRCRSRPRLFRAYHECLQRDDAGDRALAQTGSRSGTRCRHRRGMPDRRKLRPCGRVRSRLFATPGVDIGLFCSTPMVALSRNVPRKQAMEMLLTGEPISAARRA